MVKSSFFKMMDHQMMNHHSPKLLKNPQMGKGIPASFLLFSNKTYQVNKKRRDIISLIDMIHHVFAAFFALPFSK